jgi:HD-like signal output (HDOD) protein
MFSFFKKKAPHPHERLHEILGDYELPKFRKTIFETLRRLRDPKATAADIAEVMSMDADLTSRVMRTVNSTAYAPHTPIKGLSHAVTMLGNAELERIVMMLGAKMAVPNNVPQYVDMDAFWQRAGLRAVIARGLAELISPAKAGLCFSAGFLEDFSVPIIAASKGDEYAAVYAESTQGGKPLHEVEKEKFGWDHAELGALVCNEWELPKDIAAAISAQNESDSELRPDPVFFVSDLPSGNNEAWREHFKKQVLTNHDVSEEALDTMLEEADAKAAELIRLIS